jgi:hypothetical protein
MKVFLISAAVALLSHLTCAGQVDSAGFRTVFRLLAPSLDSDSTVYICGNIPRLANWNPGIIKMAPEGSHTCSAKIRSNTRFPLEYK